MKIFNLISNKIYKELGLKSMNINMNIMMTMDGNMLKIMLDVHLTLLTKINYIWLSKNS